MSTPEEKFFGTKTSISDIREANKKAREASEVEEEQIDVEQSEEDEGQVAAEKSAKPERTDDSDDDQDDRLEEYSERVQKRIDKLTWQAREAERQAKAKDDELKEAIRATQTAVQRMQEYEGYISQGEQYILAQIKEKADLKLERAQDRYRKAHEEGDTDAIIKAQQELLQASTEVNEAKAYEQNLQHRAQAQRAVPRQPQQNYQPPQPQRPKVPEPTEHARKWAEKNPWFQDPEHMDMTALAYGVHERVVKAGTKPDTPEYFEAIDNEVRRRFPEYFDGGKGQGQATSTPTKKPSTVVAPAQRGGGAKPRTVRLTPSQASIAKRLGLTPEQYARQLLKESSRNG